MPSDSGKAHRVRILQALLGICRSLESLQPTPEGQVACRAVARRLRTAISEENTGLAVVRD